MLSLNFSLQKLDIYFFSIIVFKNLQKLPKYMLPFVHFREGFKYCWVDFFLDEQICLLSTLGYFGLKRCSPNFPSGLILLNDPLILTLDGSNSQFYDTGFSRDCSLPILANPSTSEISLYNYKNHSMSTKSWQKSASNPISFKCALVELSLKTDVTYLKTIQIDFF